MYVHLFLSRLFSIHRRLMQHQRLQPQFQHIRTHATRAFALTFSIPSHMNQKYCGMVKMMQPTI